MCVRIDERDRAYVEKQKGVVLNRLKNSASGYIRVRRFNRLGRAGLKMAIEEGKVEIVDTPLGRAYQLTDKPPV